MRHPQHRPRGLVLILAAFFVFVLFTLALSFFKLVPGELNSALRTRQSVAAQVVTEAGFKDAVAWLEAQPAIDFLPQARLDADYNDAFEQAPFELPGDWSYRVRITARIEAPFLYDITSQAFFDGALMRHSLATVSRSSFARYALFIDSWREDLIFGMTPGAISGPFHTNDFFRLGLTSSDFYDPSNKPFVAGPHAYMSHSRTTNQGSLDFAGDGNAYYDSSGNINGNPDLVPYDASGPLESRYGSIVEGGRANFQVTRDIELPSSANLLYQQAVSTGHGNPPFALPSEVGFYLPGEEGRVTGGIYINGDVEIDLSLTPEGNQVHRLTQIVPEEAYRVEREVNRPIPIYQEVFIAPQPGATVTVPEYEQRMVTVTRQEIVGYREVTRTRTVRVQTGTRLQLVGGITTSVPVYSETSQAYTEQVPVYGEVTVEELQTVPTGNTLTLPDTGRTVLRPTGEYRDNFVTETEIVQEEVYLANPEAYPGAQPVLLPGGPKTGQVIEVTSEQGFRGLGVTAPKGTTVVVDYDGNVSVRQGNLNGVTFVDGNVEKLSGVSKGALTTGPAGDETFAGRYIVANPESGRSMQVTDDLLNYYDGDNPDLRDPQTPGALRRDKLSPNGQHGLGLVAEKVRLKPTRGNDVLHVYAAILAGRTMTGPDGEPLRQNDRAVVRGGFGTHESLLSSGGLNEFRLYGGLIEANADLWNAGGHGLTGQLVYDPAVANALPLFPRSTEILTLRYSDQYVDPE
jgi:hypothetical protein